MESTPSFKDDSLLSAALDSDGRQSIDNRTLFHTPAPLAASTVARPHGQRISAVQGSFLEDSSATVSSPGFDGNQDSLIKMVSFSNAEKSSAEGSNNLQCSTNQVLPKSSNTDELGVMNRSSLGILPIDNMEELSSSLLQLDVTSPQKRRLPKVDNFLQNQVIPEDFEMLDPETTPKTSNNNFFSHGYQSKNQNPYPEKIGESSDSVNVHHNVSSSLASQSKSPMTSFQGQKSFKELYNDTPHPVPLKKSGKSIAQPDQPKSDSQVALQSTSTVENESAGLDVCGGKSMDVIAATAGAGMFFGGGPPDPDASVHEVRIEADELEQFDDEFSDIGEFDNTVTDDMSPANKTETDSHNPFTQASNLFDSAHPFTVVEGDSLFCSESNIEEGVDEIDVLKQKLQQRCPDFANRPDPTMVPSFSMLKGQQEFENFKKSEFYDLIGNINSNNEDQRNSEQFTVPGSLQFHDPNNFSPNRKDPGYERAANQGEGQEEIINNTNQLKDPAEIDSKYFRKSPNGNVSFADGEESITEDSMFAPNRSSIAFGSDPNAEPPDHRLSGILETKADYDSRDSSEIDTEDEVEAVRREMKATFMRSDADDSGNPPDKFNLSADQDNVRQSAEGVVKVPLAPGDGDGCANDELQSMITQLQRQQVLYQAQPNNQQPSGNLTTFQFLQGLGILNGASPERDEAGPTEYMTEGRIKPMGDDDVTSDCPQRIDLSASAERKVRFANPLSELRERSLSGAAFYSANDIRTGYDNSMPETVEADSYQVDPNEESAFGSKYFKPSDELNSTVENESVQQAWGLEHSTFNLGDLVPSQIDDGQNKSAIRQDIVGSEEIQDENEEPEVDQDFKDRLKKITDAIGADSTFQSSEKTYIDEKSPVYINELGEGVTDLAYQVPLREVVDNPFDGGQCMQGDMSGMFGQSGHGGFSKLEDEFGSGEFMSAEKGLEMIDQDEEEFEKENIFIQDEEMKDTSNVYNSNQSLHQLGGTGASSLGLPDSWSFHTHVDNVSRPSWMSDTLDSNAAYHRISIGAFMMARTEALGSLDGKHTAQRPAFGSTIVTPPSDRKPVALYEKSSPSTTESVHNGGSFIDHEEDVRGAGVGSDSEHDLEVQDLATSNHSGEQPKNSPRAQPVPSSRPKSPEELLGELIYLSQQASKSGSSTPNQSMADVTGALDLSEITRIITAASSNAKPKELTDMILKMSQNKKLIKQPQMTTKSQQQTISEKAHDMDSPKRLEGSHQDKQISQQASQPKLVEAHFNGRPVTPQQMAKQRSSFHTEISDPKSTASVPQKPSKPSSKSHSSSLHSLRIPADGKSERTSNGVGIKQVSNNKQLTRSSVQKENINAINTEDYSLGQDSNDRNTLTNARDSRNSGGNRSTLTKSNVNRHTQQQQKRVSGSSVKKNIAAVNQSLAHDVSSDSNNNVSIHKPKVGSAQGQHAGGLEKKKNIKQSNVSQRTSTGRTSMNHQGGRKSLDKTLGQKKVKTNMNESKSMNNKPLRKAPDNEERKQTAQVHKNGNIREKSIDINQNMYPQPSTPKSFVLREKDFSKDSPTSFKNGNMECVDDIVWKSPRPSSVVSRSSKQDSSFETDNYYNNNNHLRPLEPDGAHYERSYTPPINDSVMDNISNNHWSSERHVPGTNKHQYRSLSPAHGNVTPSAQKVKRLSSTPVRDDEMGMTLGTQDTFSNIVGLSPNRRLYDDSHDTTLTMEDNVRASPKSKVADIHYAENNDITQSTPVNRNYDNDRGVNDLPQRNDGVFAYSPNNSNRYMKHSDVPNRSSPVTEQIYNHQAAKTQPTLLTSKPLSQTAFATQYLGTQSQARSMLTGHHMPSSWKSATVSADLLRGPLTSYTGADVHIQVQSELRMQEVCCVGLSTSSTLTLTNPTSKWLQVTLKLVSLSMDGQTTDMTRMMPFVMKEKVTVAPNKSEEVKVIFAPRQSGVYVGQLHVIACPVVSDRPLMPDRVPAMVTVQALAEKPHVQIMTADNSHLLDFGAIPWGCHKGLEVALVNKGRSNVPVRLVISSHKSHGYHANCFTFERYTTGDTSLISNKIRPSIPSMSPSVVNYTLSGMNDDSGDTKPQKVMIYFITPSKQMDRGFPSNPEEFTAKLDLEVDNPSSVMNLGSIVLRSVVGTARLHAPSSELEQVTLKADLGRFQTHVVPLRNAGNIPIDVSVQIMHYPECFAAIPVQLMIEPDGQSKVTVKFEPKETTPSKVETLLVLMVEPDGPSYEIPLTGERTIPQSFISHNSPLAQTKKSSSRGSLLLSKQHFLSWGGVPLGRARNQRLTIKNVAEEMLKLRLEIVATHENFQIQSLYGNKERLSMTKEIIMKPLEEYNVHVLFAPTKVTSREAKLVIRVLNTTTKYTIPLAGYGGISKLVMEGVQPAQHSNYWVGVGTPKSEQNIVAKTVIHNMGTRAAYVKCVGFHDLRCKDKLIETRIAFHPEEFCIKEKQSQEVTVIFHPNDKDILKCQEEANILTVVAFFYGDEVSRQRLRRAVQKYGTRCLTKYSADSLMNAMKFHTPFEGEDLVLEGKAVKDSPNDVELFYNTMSKMMLALVGEHSTANENLQIPLNIITSGGGAFSQDILLQSDSKQDVQYYKKAQERLDSLAPASWDSVKDRDVQTLIAMGINKDVFRDGYNPDLSSPGVKKMSPGREQKKNSPPEKDQSVGRGKVTEGIARPLTAGNVVPDWTVHPQQLIIRAPSKSADPSLKHVQLFNFTERPLSFELSWPAHCITISPEQGLIGPKKSTALSVSANVLIHSKGVPLPWCGNVHITCNGETQILKVQIRENQDSMHLESPETPITEFQPSVQEKPLVSVTTPLSNQTRIQGKVGSQQIGFLPTDVGKTIETVMEITNLTAQPIKWMLSSFTPPYLKKSSNDPSVKRVAYSAFWLPKQLGLLRGGESTKVQVCFQPKEPGLYSQHWELKSEVQVSVISASYTTKLEFYAEGLQSDMKNTVPPGVSWVDDKLSNKTTKRLSGCDERRSEINDEPIELRCERVIFPDTGKSETHKCKLEMKNCDKKAHSVTIVAPKSPFHVQHVTLKVKSRHFVRLPIEFSPRKPGHYQAELVIKPDTGRYLTIPLIGRCPEKT